MAAKQTIQKLLSSISSKTGLSLIILNNFSFLCIYYCINVLVTQCCGSFTVNPSINAGLS